MTKLTSYFCYFVLLCSVLPMIVKLLFKEEEGKEEDICNWCCYLNGKCFFINLKLGNF